MFGPHPAIFLQILELRNFNLNLIRGEWACGLLDYLEQVGPADVVHGAPGVEPVVAVLPLEGRAKVNSLGPVEVRSDILQLGLVTPVLGLSREENLNQRLESDKMSNIVKF